MLVLHLALLPVVYASVNCRGSAVCATDPGASVETIHSQIETLVAQGGGDRKFDAQRKHKRPINLE